MEIITVTKENIEKEHICCAISNNKDIQVSSKKSWLLEQFDNGLVFQKADVRGKCFIEYIPAEKAWVPVQADGYMYINCLWVSGQLKGQGNSNLLLDGCIKNSKAQGKKGLVILSAKKKMPFLADPKYLHYKGFEVADTLEPYYVLYYLPFAEGIEKPRFDESAKKAIVPKDGFALYYTNQCPYTAKYVPLVEEAAKEKGLPFHAIHIETMEQAQSAPAPFTTYSLFYNGEFVTNEILSVNKFEKLVEKLS